MSRSSRSRPEPKRKKTAKQFRPVMPDREYLIRSSLERLEDRTLLAVTSSLNNGLLSVSLGAAGDAAAISILGPKLDIFDGTTHTQYAAAQVTAITAQGSSAANQKLFLQSPVSLTGALKASSLTAIEVDGQYAASLASLSTASINLPAGSSLVATGGNVTLTTADTESGVSANAERGDHPHRRDVKRRERRPHGELHSHGVVNRDLRRHQAGEYFAHQRVIERQNQRCRQLEDHALRASSRSHRRRRPP